MKRLALLTAAIAVVVLLSPNRAYAVCQKCNNDYTPTAMCFTLNMCDQDATMSTCFETETFNPDGSVAYKHCDPDGTVQGSECNGADPSCSRSGGGGTGGTGGTGGGKGYYVICVTEMFEPCDFSLCDMCIAECWILC